MATRRWADRHDVTTGDTIFALSTPPGRSAVAVIRLSGPGAFEALTALAGHTIEPRQVRFCRFRNPATREVLDEGLGFWFPAPASFTGETCAELQVHGSAASIAALSRALAAMNGVREAQPGEFTQRAFSNGKLDLDRVEALADLIDAQTERQRRLAVRAFETSPARLAESWRHEIVGALAEIDARLDFSDEGDVDALEHAALADRLLALAVTIQDKVTRAERSTRVREGFVVAICGPPNSGKSTLLNALVGREQAIVSPHAGTTRDPIEVRLDLGGTLVTLIDTAGIRETSSEIEAIGVARARRHAETADCTLWLEAPDALGAPDPNMRVDLRVLTKADAFPWPETAFRLSAATGQGVDELVGFIAAKAAADLDESGDAGDLRQRHLRSARSVADDVSAGRTFLLQNQVELASAHLRSALAGLALLGSKTQDEDVLDLIFGRFCIGK